MPLEPSNTDLPRLEAFDAEFAHAPEHEPHLDRVPASRFRIFALVSLLFAAGVIGAMTLSWTIQWPPIMLRSATSPSGGNKEALSDQVARLMQERDALKESLKDLTAVQQQAAANIASLQAMVDELKEQASRRQLTSWHTDSSALLYQSKPERTAPPHQASGAPPSDLRASRGAQRTIDPPLSLASPSGER